MRTTVSLPEPLLENAKRRAAVRGVTVSEVIEDALRSHLSETARPNTAPFRLFTVRGKLVDPQLKLDRTSALLAEDDIEAYRAR